MEAERKNHSLIDFLATTKLVLYTVLEFLNDDDLKMLYASVWRAGANKHAAISQLIEAYLYIRAYMMGTDRSFYFLVYDSPRFRAIEKPTIAFLVSSNNKFNRLFHCREETTKFLTAHLAKAQCQQLATQIQKIAADPEIPLLRLLRETVGVGCTSTFQNFLVSLGQDPYCTSLEEYPNLSEFYQKRAHQNYIKQFFNIGRSKGRHPDYQKVKKLRLAPYLVSCEQIGALEIQNNEMHNFIIGLFAVADEMVKASEAYISGIEDPLYRFMEFCLRYCIYRNFVISVQQKFASIFDLYSGLYEEYFDEDIEIPDFSFWRPAYSKWVLAMEKFHKEMTLTYNYCILEKRHRGLGEKIEAVGEKDRSDCYSVVRNWIQSIDVEGLFFNEKPRDREVWETLQDEICFCLNEYSDYQMDISLDEVTVHWCGHTKQKTGEPFLIFQAQVAEANSQFYAQLFRAPQIEGSPDFASFIVDADLNNIQNNHYYKEKIIAQVAEIAIERVKKVCQGKANLTFTLSNSDERMEIYNEKAKIPFEIPDEASRQLYQIKPLPEEEIIKYIEKHTISTVDESGLSLEEEEDYHSDNDDDLEGMCAKGEEIESFMQDEEADYQNPLYSPINENIWTKGL